MDEDMPARGEWWADKDGVEVYVGPIRQGWITYVQSDSHGMIVWTTSLATFQERFTTRA